MTRSQTCTSFFIRSTSKWITSFMPLKSTLSSCMTQIVSLRQLMHPRHVSTSTLSGTVILLHSESARTIHFCLILGVPTLISNSTCRTFGTMEKTQTTWTWLVINSLSLMEMCELNESINQI